MSENQPPPYWVSAVNDRSNYIAPDNTAPSRFGQTDPTSLADLLAHGGDISTGHGNYANWLQRVAASLIDQTFMFLPTLVITLSTLPRSNSPSGSGAEELTNTQAMVSLLGAT